MRPYRLMLPRPPGLEEIRANTPRITPIADSADRPFWSVMIPTYNSGPYLQRTLESVLAQALSPEEMQIEVVDGCSTTDDPRPIVDELGQGRVTFHRIDRNRGPAYTFNACIQRARGHWLHILHGDDMVLPGFYDVYSSVIHANSEARTVLGQAIKIDESDRWTGLSGAEPPPGGGVMLDFVERQAVRQLVVFPSVVVRRDGYEQAGGFCTLFDHVTDWDMWFRLGEVAPVAWVPRPYSLYRIHAESDTSRQRASAANIRESYFVITANLARLNGRAPSTRDGSWQSGLSAYAEAVAWQLDWNNTEGRYNQARWAWMLEPNTRRLVTVARLWLKHKLRSQFPFRRAGTDPI